MDRKIDREILREKISLFHGSQQCCPFPLIGFLFPPQKRVVSKGLLQTWPRWEHPGASPREGKFIAISCKTVGQLHHVQCYGARPQELVWGNFRSLLWILTPPLLPLHVHALWMWLSQGGGGNFTAEPVHEMEDGRSLPLTRDCSKHPRLSSSPRWSGGLCKPGSHKSLELWPPP